jgi:amino acid adenylation domain-containing protein
MNIISNILDNKDLILSFGKGQVFNYDKNLTVHAAIEYQALNNPNSIAVQFQNHSLTYTQLNQRANQVARYLVRQGVEPHSNVCIYLEPSLNLIISLLAVLKTGSCYIPLDVSYPTDRLKFVLAQSRAILLLTQSNLASNLSNLTDSVVEIDRDVYIISQEKTENLLRETTSDSRAYILYTSGSTGTPKGVSVHHRAVMNHMIWMENHFQFNNSDVILLKTPLLFDPSVWEIFLPLCIGAKLIVAPEKSYLNPDVLIQLIESYQITTIQFVPVLLDQFLKRILDPCPSLRRVFVGGESLNAETKKMFFKKLHCDLYNLYGPTETTIDIVSHKVTSSDVDKNIIGKPIYNTHLYVLDHHKNIVDIEQEGELYITGDGLSQGYYNNLQSTQENFLNNPFCLGAHETMYRTGDIVKWDPSGNLIYIGRVNDQIKINGVRIEPDELKHHILNNHAISDCVITKRLDRENKAVLACYLIPKREMKIDISEIHNNLKKFFPSFMLPKYYEMIDKIPININGKTDLKALPNPTIVPSKKSDELKSKISTDVEKKLFCIWKKLLGFESIGYQDNFFDLGGNSILSFKLLNEIESEFKIDITIHDLFLYPVFYEQIRFINRFKGNKINKIKRVLENSLIPLNKQDHKKPIFLIHPIGGTVFWYSYLAKLLDFRKVFAIADPAIELGEKIFSSITEMADAYANLIQKVQPSGPYLIGGASFGATVALEIAKILMEKNEKIDLVPILDGWAVYPDTLYDDQYFKQSMLRQHADLKERFKQYNLSEPKGLLDIQWHRLSLLFDFHLSEILHPIALFKARELLPIFEVIDAPFNYWEKFSRISMRTYVVPGNHETMFQKPQVHILASSIKESLDSVDDSS